MAEIESDGDLFVTPTDKERGYRTGWYAYHHGRLLNSNEFNPDDELDLYEGFIDGWASAQLEDTSDS